MPSAPRTLGFRATSMEATLTVIGGKTSKRTITLRKLPAVIGRGKEARLTIAHPMVSRRHCELTEKGGLLLVRDLGSMNGTLVGGRRIKEAPLPPGGEFSIGPLSFRAQYQYDGDRNSLPATVWAEPAAASPAPPAEEVPDFEDIDDTSPVPQKAAKTAKAAKRKDDDDGVSFFEELGLDESDEPAGGKELATARAGSKPDEKATAQTPRPGSIKPAGKPAEPAAARPTASPAKTKAD